MCNHVRTLPEIFTEALNDDYTIECNGKGYSGYLSLGIKIIRDAETTEIKILNTHFNCGFYKKIREEEMEIFMHHGWRYGCLEMALKNNLCKIDLVNAALKGLGNSKRQKKLAEELTAHREQLKARYNELLSRKSNYLKKLNLKSND